MKRFGFRRPVTIAAALLALAAAALAAGAAGGERAPGSVQGGVRLIVWDQEVRGGQNLVITQLNREFERRNPGVKIERVAKSFNDLQTTIRLAVSGPNPPDVVQANRGRDVMGLMVKAGLLLPLNKYANRYGWNKRFSRGLMQLNSYSPDGAVWGGQNLYGLSQVGQLVGVYYNKQKLAQLGVGVPRSFEQFERVLKLAKAKGEVPIQFGNLDKWPGIHEFQAVENVYASKQLTRAIIFGRSGVSFATGPNVAAAGKLAGWASAGYFTQDFSGLGYDDAWHGFTQGSGVFLITGTWLNPDLVKAMGSKVGFFLLPPRKGGKLVTVGGAQLPFAVVAKSKNADLAARYLDFLTNAHAMRLVLKNGGLPAVPVRNAPVAKGTSLADVLRAWDAAHASDALVEYLDHATPTMYNTATAAVQELLGDQISAKDFAAKVESDHAKFVKSK